ncbi:MAG: hypothetical protein DPW12_06125 [Rhodocyclaceae bacterium]|nr:hypothetical protein [Rhodocyclaceae bacterium]
MRGPRQAGAGGEARGGEFCRPRRRRRVARILAMANRTQWDPRLGVGHDTLDAQHRDLLAHCNALADCLAETGAEAGKTFRRLFEELMALSREHFAAEEALLAKAGYPDLEAYRHEREEFDYLAADIATTENFDKDELQTFLALWWSSRSRPAEQTVRHSRASGNPPACIAGTIQACGPGAAASCRAAGTDYYVIGLMRISA